jgi:type II secretory pathway pseudopilin PulG
MKVKRKGEGGFSLVEVVLTFAIMAVATTALGLVEVSNARRSQELKERDIAFGRGQAIMERILCMPYGAPTAPTATGAKLDLLFGSDSNLREPGQEVYLTEVMQKDTDSDGTIDDEPIRFTLEGVEDKGTWEVLVDSDLDGNGVIEPTITVDGVDIETREGRTDLMRIEIRRNGRTVLKTLRARTPQEQDDTEAP